MKKNHTGEAKAVTPPKPTAAEMELMRLLWVLGPATAKQVHEAAIKERPDLAYASVLRMLQVMHSKGQLRRDESQKAHVYAAVEEQDALQTNLVKDLIQKAFSGSAKALILSALRTHVSKEEREEIQKFLHGDEK
ncbi:BlaI/MecI/CopY family transcriptional regulator [Undibacterium fentianense]|uniref:BlaI/MecI/CopY family transcriptional regulator n=1 Tax=Undibacterium fentianense TaxID=2828728 RepID=A0A941DXQ9_9BURK|nr:BlaI/MecI/CopY family transcriptional regulator [Undibacterium fentianense]MBR7798670.1 BlaI/MecI/CopY family transcriptional regulator [Undibacterium fentianense]